MCGFRICLFPSTQARLWWKWECNFLHMRAVIIYTNDRCWWQRSCFMEIYIRLSSAETIYLTRPVFTTGFKGLNMWTLLNANCRHVSNVLKVKNGALFCVFLYQRCILGFGNSDTFDTWEPVAKYFFIVSHGRTCLGLREIAASKPNITKHM